MHMESKKVSDFYKKLKEEKKIDITGVGTFMVKKQEISAHWGKREIDVIKFYPTRELKDYINDRHQANDIDLLNV